MLFLQRSKVCRLEKMEKETSHGIKDLNKKELEERKEFQELETVSEVWVVAFNILEKKQF